MNKVYEIITKQVISLLDKGVVPWNKTWKGGESSMPANWLTKTTYRGINVFTLSLAGMTYSSNYWLTWKQVEQLRGEVKKEERAKYQFVVFWKPFTFEEENADGGMDVKSSWMLRYYRVYNTDQCTFPEKVAKQISDTLNANKAAHEETESTNCRGAKRIADGYKNKPVIKHGGDIAAYSPMLDLIKMPNKKDFDTCDSYYATLFHEMGHSTGHDSRLKRAGVSGNTVFGDQEYSKEELIAEMTAAFLCGVAGIENNTIENQAAYIAGWKRKLSEDNMIVVMAAAQAQKAADHILGKVWEDRKTAKTEEE